jgi:glycosyltransferase involved in cell wall biosynthesis
MDNMDCVVNNTDCVVNKTKLLFVSTHINQTNGYAKVAYYILKELAKLNFMEIIHFGIHKNESIVLENRVYPDNIKVINASSGLGMGMSVGAADREGFAFSKLSNVISSEKPHIVMIYNDASIICKYIEELNKTQDRIDLQYNIWAYIDQVYTTELQQHITTINSNVDKLFCFSKSWKKNLIEQGIHRPIHVLPHGVDTGVFYPGSREEARMRCGISNDYFVFLSVNRNQPRKRLDILIMSFVQFIVRNPLKPVILMMICDRGENGGYPIFEIYHKELRRNKLSPEVFGTRLLVTSEDNMYQDSDINMFYNLADVGISCADGEGFGLCCIEGMAAGLAQIVPAVGGHIDYCTTDNCQLIEPKYSYYLPLIYSPIGGKAHAVDVADVVRSMEKCMHYEDFRKSCVLNANKVVQKYTWERVTRKLIHCLHNFQNELRMNADDSE